ncbi:hypothetical protein VCHC47A1_3569, partial [Vibrio cholerae HC-47A1]
MSWLSSASSEVKKAASGTKEAGSSARLPA